MSLVRNKAMSSVSSVAGYGVALSQAEFSARYQVAVLKKQLEVMQEMGDMALQLIQSVPSVPSEVGNLIDIRA